MIASKITLLLSAILGLFFQVSMAQSATTFTTSAVAEVPTGVPSDLDNIEWVDEDLDDGDFDDGEFHLEDDEEDQGEDYHTDLDDNEVVLEGKRPGHRGGSRKKPKGYKGVKGWCNSNRVCDVHDPPHNCKCTHPNLSCTCKVPFF